MYEFEYWNRLKGLSFTHKDCLFFKDGFCTLNNVAVEPNDIACPSFIPKELYQRAYQSPYWLSYPPWIVYYPALYYFTYPWSFWWSFPPFIVPVYPFPPPFTSPEEELYALEAYREELEAEIELLNRRIEELRRVVKGFYP